jgi:FAD/FMN-containing dehydrogenase
MYARRRNGGWCPVSKGSATPKKTICARIRKEQIELMRRIKLAFDPKQILNPGKVCQ